VQCWHGLQPTLTRPPTAGAGHTGRLAGGGGTVDPGAVDRLAEADGPTRCGCGLRPGDRRRDEWTGPCSCFAPVATWRHLPVCQAESGVDPAAVAGSGRGGSVDLVGAAAYAQPPLAGRWRGPTPPWRPKDTRPARSVESGPVRRGFRVFGSRIAVPGLRTENLPGQARDALRGSSNTGRPGVTPRGRRPRSRSERARNREEF